MAGEQIKVEKRKGIFLSQEEYDLVMFIRNELPYGSCTLITHGGKPKRAEDPKSIKFFGQNGGVDKNET